ncbi:MAG: hypothetical protein AMXMBFR53_33510 [Gemmatimonadota bacterium]
MGPEFWIGLAAVFVLHFGQHQAGAVGAVAAAETGLGLQQLARPLDRHQTTIGPW